MADCKKEDGKMAFNKLSPNKKKLIVGIIIACIILIFLGIRINHNGGIFTPKEVSFVKQAKQGGKHVWFEADGKQGSSKVFNVFVTGGGKITQYKMQDNDITLSKLSGKSNSQLIRIAKKQNKKYFDAYATDAKRIFPHVASTGNVLAPTGQNHTFVDTDSGKGLPNYFYMIYDGARINMSTEDNKFRSPDDDLYSSDYRESNYNNLVRLSQMRTNALANAVKTTKYVAPKAAVLHVSDAESDEGNDGRTISFKATANWLGPNSLDRAYYKTIDKNGVNKVLATYWSGKGKPQDREKKASKEYAKLVNQQFYNKIMKEAFYYSTYTHKITLLKPIKFSITDKDYNDKYYIGYDTDYSNAYVVTPAKNSKQKAVLSNN